MPYFSEAIDRYFAYWLGRSTWHTEHPLDEREFLRFVMAIHSFSKEVGRKGNRKWVEDESGFVKKVGKRNPRTYDERAFREKIEKAILQNYPHFDKEFAHGFAQRHAQTAMIILDFLWTIKEDGFPSGYVDRSTLRLK